jgi:hypothetical protein
MGLGRVTYPLNAYEGGKDVHGLHFSELELDRLGNERRDAPMPALISR